MSRKPPAGTAGPVGRDGVLAGLRRVVDEAVAGRGRLLLLAGEAGIGKTTMLTAAAGYAEGCGARVAWGWGWPGEGAPGYWPWVQVMRALGLDIPWPAGESGQAVRDAPASERFRLFDEVTSLLLAESRIQPLLLLLDDLQWADQPSQLLLDFLARRLPAGAVAVVGSYRDTEPAPGPAPGPVLAALAGRATVLPLTGLGPDAVGALVAGVVGEQRAAEVAAGVHRRTGGNPFFVQQVTWLLSSGQDGIPPGVHEALELRFAALPAAAAATLRAAAVIGQRFSADLVGRVIRQPPASVTEAVDAAVRARVVSRDGPDVYRFAHDLFREYAYEQLPAAGRASLHREIGHALEASRAAGGDVPLAELARHFVLADPASAPAWEYSVAAAREATARLAYEEAVRHWEHAVAAADARPAGRTGALLELAEARRRAGQGQAAGQAYLRAAERARADRDAAQLARAALGLHAIGTRAWWPPDQVVALLSEALDALGPSQNDDPLRLRVMASLARALAWHGLDLPRARTLAAEAVAAARAGGDPLTLAACLLAQHHAVWAPDTAPERLRIAAEVAELAERAADAEILLEVRLLAANDRLELADPAFRAELEEFLRLAATSRQPRFRYAALVRRATLALLAGRLEETGQLIAQAEMLGEECGEPGVRDVRYDQGWDLLTAQGRLGELAGTLPEMFPDPESTQARGARAQVLIAAGARDEAAAVITGRYPGYQGVEAMCSPRRTLLDRVLVDAARAAGAEVRENFAVEEILGDGQVTGIRGREKGAPAVTEQARLVIGADGKHSLVAKAVGARAYRTRPPRSIAFYTYWADVPARDGSPAGTGEIYGRPGCAVSAWPTNDGLLMTYLAWPAARFEEFRRDVEGNILRSLDAVGLGERIRAGRRAERFRGTPDLPSYLRQPYGPGWALVGDAGLLLDPITGHGISNAFRDAELLADAVADGLGGIRPLAEALARYHRARDRAARPMYDFTARLAAVSPPTPAEIALFRAIARRQEDADMFFGTLAGSVPLRQFMSPRTMVRLVGVRGFARLALGQARPHRAGATADPQFAEGNSARSAENASTT